MSAGSKILNSRKSLIAAIIIFFLAIIAALLVMLVTSRYGIGINFDSISYIAGGENISNGNGIVTLYNVDGSIPLNFWATSYEDIELAVFRWPPFYPIILSIPSVLGMSAVAGAKFIAAFFMGANIALLGWMLYRYTRSIVITILSSLLIFSTGGILYAHTNAFSEPLFVFVGFLGIYLLTRFFHTKKIMTLVIGSLSIGLAFITRYIGIALVVAGILFLLFFDDVKLKTRFRNLAIFISLSCLPMIIWLICLRIIVGSPATLNYYGFALDELKELITIIANWFVPLIEINWVSSLLFIILVLLSAALIYYFYLRKRLKAKIVREELSERSLVIFPVYIFCHIFFLILSRVFFTPSVNTSYFRLLLPIFIPLVILGAIFLNRILLRKKTRIVIKTSIILVISVYIGLHAADIGFWAKDKYINGQGYLQAYYLESETIKELKDVPEDIPIYSNGPDVIYLFNNRPAFFYPTYTDFSIEGRSEDPELDFANIIEEAKDKKAYFVDFYGIKRDYLLSINDIKRKINLCLIEKNEDGEIYRVCPSRDSTLLKTDYTNFVDHWLPLSDCEFFIDEGKIMVNVFGADPFFENKFPLDFGSEDVFISISMTSSVKGELRIFYGKEGQPYKWEESFGYPIKEGFNEIKFRLPLDEIQKIRIDPIDSESNCAIEEIIFFTPLDY